MSKKKKKKNRNNTSNIMKRHTDRLSDGKSFVTVSYDDDENTLTFEMQPEIIKYHRHRHTRWATYDPMGKYKEILQDMISNAMEEEGIILSEELMDMPIEVESYFVTVPVKSGNSIGVIALMLLDLIKRTKAPDIDNFNKTAYDVFNGLIWTDDSQVFKHTSTKLYGREERTVIKVKYVPNYGYFEDEDTAFRKLLEEGIISEDDLEFARHIKNN